MHPKIRFYRRDRRGRWEYLCSTTHFASKDEARLAFLRQTPTPIPDLRVEFAATHGYELED